MAADKSSPKRRIEEAAAGLGCTAVLLLVIAVIAFQAMGSQSPKNALPPSSPSATEAPSSAAVLSPTTTPSSVPTPLPAVRPGQQRRVSALGSGTVFAATTSENYDALAKAVRIGDRVGSQVMVAEGRLIVLDTGTRVLVLDGYTFLASLKQIGFDGDVVQVRVLEGKHFGRAVWLVIEHVGSL